MIFQPIHHTFAPHADRAYVREALRLLFQPWKWQKGEESEELHTALVEHFHADVTLFASGREALLALLHALHMDNNDEVIIQSYTCVVVPNAIKTAGATPVYADIDPDTLNLTPETVEKVISHRTKAIICQHTFGIPADTERLRRLCDRYELPLIEDCAHIIPDGKGPKEIGQHGDCLILSFGRDKAISGITGGAIIVKDKSQLCHPEGFAGRISRRSLDKLGIPQCDTANRLEGSPQLSTYTIFRLLLYPLLYTIARPLYGFGIGKLLLWLAAKLGLLVPIVTRGEKEGHMPPTLHAIPNACAALALTQLRKLQQINDHRRSLTKFYLQACKDRGWPVLEGITEDLPLQKFPMLLPSPLLPQRERGRGRGCEGAHHLRSLLTHKNIHLSDGWTGCVICPSSVENFAQSILSLPTHPTMRVEQAHILIDNLTTIMHKGIYASD